MWDSEQATVERGPDGAWQVVPRPGTTNETLLNGAAITTPQPLHDGRRDRRGARGEGDRKAAAHRAAGLTGGSGRISMSTARGRRRLEGGRDDPHRADRDGTVGGGCTVSGKPERIRSRHPAEAGGDAGRQRRLEHRASTTGDDGAGHVPAERRRASRSGAASSAGAGDAADAADTVHRPAAAGRRHRAATPAAGGSTGGGTAPAGSTASVDIRTWIDRAARFWGRWIDGCCRRCRKQATLGSRAATGRCDRTHGDGRREDGRRRADRSGGSPAAAHRTQRSTGATDRRVMRTTARGYRRGFDRQRGSSGAGGSATSADAAEAAAPVRPRMRPSRSDAGG